VSKQIGD